jgi:hypothetical protein
MDFEKVVKEGKYYYSASDRYGVGSIIICDRCHIRDLKSCIGLDQLDLCLSCVDDLQTILKAQPTIEKNPVPPFMTTQEGPLTKMMSSSMQPDSSSDDELFLTRMYQSSFRTRTPWESWMDDLFG